MVAVKSLFINLGEDFKDKSEMINFIKALESQHKSCTIFNYAREKLHLINSYAIDNDNDEITMILVFETNGCESKNRIRALMNLISEIYLEPAEVYFLPTCPKELLMVAQEQFKYSKIFRINYLKREMPIRIN